MLTRSLPATVYWPKARMWRLAGVAVLFIVWVAMQINVFLGDAHTYWAAWNRDEVYGPQVWNVDADAYVYPPPFALAVWPLAQLPWEAFYAAWSALLIIGLAWMIGPPWAAISLLPWEPFRHVVASGGANTIVAVALAASAYPASWTAIAFSKVTPAVAVFSEWRRPRRMLFALGVMAVIFVATLPWWPLWLDWIAAMQRGGPPLSNAIDVPLFIRLPGSFGVALIAGYLRRPWITVVAAWLALPNFATLGSLVLLAAIPRLLRHSSRTDAKARAAPE